MNILFSRQCVSVQVCSMNSVFCQSCHCHCHWVDSEYWSAQCNSLSVQGCVDAVLYWTRPPRGTCVWVNCVYGNWHWRWHCRELADLQTLVSLLRLQPPHTPGDTGTRVHQTANQVCPSLSQLRVIARLSQRYFNYYYYYYYLIRTRQQNIKDNTGTIKTLKLS